MVKTGSVPSEEPVIGVRQHVVNHGDGSVKAGEGEKGHFQARRPMASALEANGLQPERERERGREGEWGRRIRMQRFSVFFLGGDGGECPGGWDRLLGGSFLFGGG